MTLRVREPTDRRRPNAKNGFRNQQHADGIHNRDDAVRMVHAAVREKWSVTAKPGRKGNTYAWVHAMGDDWCVVRVESSRDCKLLLVEYMLAADDTVIFGEPVEVVAWTVYEPVMSTVATGTESTDKTNPAGAMPTTSA